MLKIDFGSGYNPNKEYKTCDITGSPILDYLYDKKDTILDLKEKSVDEFYLRNVVHHIPDLKRTFKCLKKYLKDDGKIKIIECKKENYYANWFLDSLWYRYVIPREEIWFSDKYRDYKNVLLSIGFKKIESYEENEKEISIWELKN